MRELVRGKPGIDVLGQEYGPGDLIAAAINSYGGPTILVGTVVSLGSNRVRVTPVARTNYAFEERDSSISPERVVKVMTGLPKYEASDEDNAAAEQGVRIPAEEVA